MKKNLFEFKIKGRIAGANDYIGASRSNKYTSNNMKRKNEKYIKECWEESSNVFKQITNDDLPLTICIDWVEGKDNSRSKYRDVDNITFGTKFILDALMDLGVIVDDNISVISNIRHTITKTKDEPSSAIVKAYRTSDLNEQLMPDGAGTIKFAIEGRLSGTNEHINECRTHYAVGHRNKKENQLKVNLGLRKYHKPWDIKQKEYPLRIDVLWKEGKKTPRSKLRDVDNINFGVKFILDELVSLGVIKDDDIEHVSEINHLMEITDDPHIIVAITSKNKKESE